MMGRATSPTGVHLDKDGVRMDLEHGPDSGGTILTVERGINLTNTRYQILGHSGACDYPVKGGETKYVFSFHFHPEGGADEILAAKQMFFDDDGWPVVTVRDFYPTEAMRNELCNLLI